MADKEIVVTYGVLSERTEVEKRTGITPDIVTRLKRSGVACVVEQGVGLDAHFTDADFEKAGARVATRDEVIASSDVLGFVGRPSEDTLASIKPGTWVIGALQSFTDEAYVDSLKQRGLTSVAMERLPRQLSSAQSMDEMTSQNSVTGYKAVLKAADAYGSFFPMMTTAAGTIRPAKVLVLGAGIAGLQAIGTAKRLGAVVTAYDVRPAAKSEVESLGAKFLDLDVDLTKGQGDGGYARELTAEERAAQQAAVDRKAADFDVIITTAQVPGRKPPMLLTSAGVNGLKRGAVIVDCAASEFGGNVEGSVARQRVVTESGVTIIGDPDLASSVPVTASQQIARNLADTVVHFVREAAQEGAPAALTVDMNDEIDAAMVVAGGDK
ncbi:NAD(P) transhydrogenase subunit alpha [Alloscardovia omnicolens]|uniref:proton-translocating NAD(P)(+) transhydrogenase n=1 Tax=Alloscardovia omnicolens F0580 TaxID=1321816 RepID=U1R9A3_9BIFI|nr:NAD(P) transhydrogenase subunit alpha [Alloscardovia omnicolens]ERH30134.1 putative NAD(P)(+) transhydrogenase, alpha subunit [Alloscardovia omnicolens F0580]MDK6250539.1 NAD(P) transhydrogenase subunit alpha [Alloscardovia omnicolens]